METDHPLDKSVNQRQFPEIPSDLYEILSVGGPVPLGIEVGVIKRPEGNFIIKGVRRKGKAVHTTGVFGDHQVQDTQFAVLRGNDVIANIEGCLEVDQGQNIYYVDSADNWTKHKKPTEDDYDMNNEEHRHTYQKDLKEYEETIHPPHIGGIVRQTYITLLATGIIDKLISSPVLSDDAIHMYENLKEHQQELGITVTPNEHNQYVLSKTKQ